MKIFEIPQNKESTNEPWTGASLLTPTQLTLWEKIKRVKNVINWA